MRHKKTYFRKSDRCEDCYEMVLIRRNSKPKSSIRRAMWRAWWNNYIESYNKKYKIDE